MSKSEPSDYIHRDSLMRRHGFLHAFDRNIEVSSIPLPSERSRLLLVEKDAAMRDVLMAMLAPHYEVAAVSDGLEACLAAELQPPALIIIDLYIPGTDNLTLIRTMRSEERTARMPIILLTASTHKEILLRCLAAGASNFLLKPFNVVELLMCARIESHLRGVHAEPDL